jgi:hypothetical protein
LKKQQASGARISAGDDAVADDLHARAVAR